MAGAGSIAGAPCTPLEYWASIANIALTTLALCCLALDQRRQCQSAEFALQKAAASMNAEQKPEEAALLQDRGAGRRPSTVTKVFDARKEPNEDHRERAEDLMRMNSCKAAILGLALPFSTVSVLGSRLDSVFLQHAGAAITPMMACSACLAILCGMPGNVISGLIGVSMLLMVAVLLHFCRIAHVDRQWRDIDGFLDHRRLKPTLKNFLAVASILAACAQLGALATKLYHQPPTGEEMSSYDKAKLALASFLSFFMLDLSFLQDVLEKVDSMRPALHYAVYFQPGMSVFCVLLWWLLYAGIFHKVVSLARSKANGDHNSIIDNMKVRTALYSGIATRTKYTTAFLLMSDTLQVPILVGLVKMVDCWRDQDGVYRLEIDPGVVCFTGWHAGASIVAILSAAFFGVTTILTAPFIIADSDSIFTSDALDAVYEPLFYTRERLCRCTVAVSAIFFDHYPGIPRNLNFLAAVYLAWISMTTQPCSIIWVNALRTAVCQASAIVALSVMLDAISVMEWMPLLIVPVFVGGLLLRLCCRLGSMAKPPRFCISESVGEKYVDSVSFTDVSILRGSSHRVAALAAWSKSHEDDGDDGFHGVQVLYLVDGVPTAGSCHFSSWYNSVGPPNQLETLEGDEFLMAMHTGDCRRFCAFRTSKGRVLVLGDTQRGRREVELLGDDDWQVQSTPGAVVSLYGSHNGHIHTLGFILQVQE